MLKSGDKRKVRKDLVVDEHYGSVRFDNKMKKWMGLDITILELDNDIGCRVKEDEDRFIWTEAMFEPVDDGEEMEKGFAEVWLHGPQGYPKWVAEYFFKAGAEWQRGRGEKP